VTPIRLSPSSARDFKTCPQLFKFRSVDRLPEPPSPAAARGTLVHAVLERLYELEPPARTPPMADTLLAELLDELAASDEAAELGLAGDMKRQWLSESRRLLDNFFKLEDPRELTSGRLEWRVEYETPELHLRGIIDRIEERPGGAWILSDYKTGRVPSEARERQAFFALRFYALVCWRAFGVMPEQIRLLYLSDPQVLTLEPQERMLVAFERQMTALAKAVARALATGDWRTRPSALCAGCSFRELCPAYTA
jgi:putative RecB family exonuclease